MNIVFMGTPALAATILKALVESGEHITGVFTQTDKPKGRGNKLVPSEVKEYALGIGLDVYQPKSLRTPEAYDLISSLNPDIIIVAAYGKILPQNILSLPKCGCINVHGSILPKYRGAAPIQRCLTDGVSETGVTLMMMDEGCDTGKVIDIKRFPVTHEMNCGELFELMAKEGAEILLKNLPSIKDGSVVLYEQDDKEATQAPKIDKSELALDFNKNAEALHNLVRGVYPLLVCECTQKTAKGIRRLKIAKTEVSDKEYEGVCGQVVFTDAKLSQIGIKCGIGTLIIKELIPEGKSKMTSADYIRGRQIIPGEILV